MPVLPVGGEKSFRSIQAVIMRHVATNVQEAVIAGLSDRALDARMCLRPSESWPIVPQLVEFTTPICGSWRTS